MATGALSYAQYQADGTTATFSVPFQYLRREHVEVSVDGTEVSFTWDGDSTVRPTAVPPQDSIVEVRRRTPREERLVRFSDGSTTTAATRNTNSDQTFFIVQEAFDFANSTLAVTSDGSYSAQTRRIANVGDPVDQQDAVTKDWAETAMSSQVLQASNSASAAASSEANAAASESAAASSETNAAESESKAATSETKAATSETNAAGSASAAAASETNAAASESAAAASLYDFTGTWYGGLADDPIADPNGDPPDAGDAYLNTATDTVRVYTGSVWQPVGPYGTAAERDIGGTTSAVPDVAVLTTGTGLPFVDGERVGPVETGAWTPVLEGSVVAGSHSYNKTWGIYKRLGDWVFCAFRLQPDTYDTGASGEGKITGLPFLNTPVGGAYTGVPEGNIGIRAVPSDFLSMSPAILSPGEDTIRLRYVATDGGDTALDVSDFGRGRISSAFIYYIGD